jgi:hypothetical protein
MSFHGDVSLSCFSQAKKFLDVEVERDLNGGLPIQKWRVHDLRRTMATGFQRLGVRFEVTEAALLFLEIFWRPLNSFICVATELLKRTSAVVSHND